MITREFKLYLNAGVGVAPVINVNQFDQDEEWIFTLLQSDGTVYTPSTGAIIGLKQDGTTILNAGTVNSSGQVVITETEQMTAVPGSNLFEILIDGNSHGTANFVVFVERRPGDIDNPSESDISLFQEAIEAAGNVTQFQADISALQSGLATTNANLTSEANTRASADATLQSNISAEASTRSTQDAVLQAEIDQLIAPSGEAPSAAEVQNARIGVDGTTYDTLGNAIRGQVSDLKNALTILTGNTEFTYTTNTSISRTDLPTQQTENNWESVVIPCVAGDVFNVKGWGGMSTRLWMFCDSNGTLLTESANSLHTDDFVKIVAPYNSAYLCCNSQYTSIKGEVYKETFIRDILNTLNQIVSENIPYTLYKGYVGGDGVINPQDLLNSAKKEVYTNKIPIKKEFKINIKLQYNSASDTPMWLAVALYDENGDFKQRVGLASNLANRMYYEVDMDFTNYYTGDDVYYISFTFASYGDSVFSISTVNISDIKEYIQKDEHDLQLSKNSNNVKSILHRGIFGFPENTIIGYKQGKINGFDIVECDVRFTSDGVPVLLHDTTINRTARNADGTALSSSTAIANITYEQALTYDFGYYVGYVGVQIPTFEQFIKLCKNISLHPYIEVKAGTTEQIQGLVTTVKNCGMLDNVTWIADNGDRLEPIISVYTKARLGMVVTSVQDWVINRVSTLKTGENEVFVFSSGYTEAYINKCKNADVPLEVWLVDTVSDVLALDPYITGIESNIINAQYALYKGSI